MESVLRIGPATFTKSATSGVFELSLDQLDELRFTEVPYYSTIDVTGLPGELETYQLTITATHGGGSENEYFALSVHVMFVEQGSGSDDSVSTRTCDRKISRARHAMQRLSDDYQFDGGSESRHGFDGKHMCGLLYTRYFGRADNPCLGEYIAPAIECFSDLIERPDICLFLCHASEDKAFAETLAHCLDTQGVPIWYDRREIRAGDSIVERVSQGLESASHLVVVLSQASVTKRWVQRELASSLMKQLEQRSIIVVPLLIEDCSVPILLADVRYVDCRNSVEAGAQELIQEIMTM